MNAKGLNVLLHGVSTALSMPYYQSLVTDGTIRQDEFDGTRHNIATAVATLKNTPEEKIESLVAEYDADLTAYLAKFNAVEQTDYHSGFRLAQVIAGSVATIMAKAGIKG
jgi:histidine ammonia-lyase